MFTYCFMDIVFCLLCSREIDMCNPFRFYSPHSLLVRFEYGVYSMGSGHADKDTKDTKVYLHST